MRKRFLLIFYFICLIISLNAQSNFSIGVNALPGFYKPNNYNFYYNSNSQYFTSYGLNFEIILNKNLSLSLKPYLLFQKFNSLNLDTITDRNAANGLGNLSRYYISNNLRHYTGSIVNKNIDFELSFMYKFIKHKYSKWGKYIYLGNTIRYNISYEDVVKKNDTQEIVYNFKGKSSEIMQYFQPTVGLGIEYLITKNSGIFSDIFYKTFRNNYFDNFTLGLALGIKAKL